MISFGRGGRLKCFFIGDGSRKIGPFTASEISEMLFDCRLGLLDQVFDARSKEWIPATSVEKDSVASSSPSKDFRPEEKGSIGLPSSGISDPDDEPQTRTIPGLFTPTNSVSETAGPRFSTPAGKSVVVESESFQAPAAKPLTAAQRAQIQWYLQEGSIVLGPYSYATMLGMIMDGTIREYDLVRSTIDSSWIAAKDCKAFAIEELKAVAIEDAAKLVARGGFKRKHARKDVNETVVVHGRGSLHRIVMGDISVGGCSLIANMPLFKEGEEIMLSIFDDALSAKMTTNGEGASPVKATQRFNAKATVVRVVQRTGAEAGSFKHSIRFLTVTKSLMDRIKERLVS